MMNGKEALFQVSYHDNLKVRVLATVDGAILLDTFITEELGPVKTDDVTIQMSKSSLSNFAPPAACAQQAAANCVQMCQLPA